MKNQINLLLLFLLSLAIAISSPAQQVYKYSVDLTKADDDLLTINLFPPAIAQKEIHFYLPQIVPGTYMNSNFGKFVHDLQALDKEGKMLPLFSYGDNDWLIRHPENLYRISYQVEDTRDSKIRNKVYDMAGTNFEAGKNFVLNTTGLFGYFEGMKDLPFELTFTKPTGFYAASALVPQLTTNTTDVFLCRNANHMYDSPIMYSLPDTASIKVGNASILVAVYSPNKKATATFIAKNLQPLMLGAYDYLGGKLPIDKYTFIFNFNGEQAALKNGGAQEHCFSSLYTLDEKPEKEAIGKWLDMAAHEFFHILSPLNISSKEVKEFSFNKTILSKHLWLYEGSTEYDAYNMQAWSGILSPEKYLDVLADKISYSRRLMNDSLSFTELSKESAGKYNDQYYNVYQKGALIATCIDLYLLKLSNATYGLRQLKNDLSVKYGKTKYFEDDSLFTIISKLSYPEMNAFFKTYVEGSTPIPYEVFFAMAGVEYLPSADYMEFSIGGLKLTSKDGLLHAVINQLNVFGKTMDFQAGDILVSINENSITETNFDTLANNVFKNAKEGELLTVKVKRKNKKDKLVEVSLRAPLIKIKNTRYYVLRYLPDPTMEQLNVRNTWLNNHAVGVSAGMEEVKF